MKILSGCDIVKISDFEQSLKMGNKSLIENLFLKDELDLFEKMESLAGCFAAKEALIKAFDLKAQSWLKIKIFKNQNGKPMFKFLGENRQIEESLSSSISISHDGDYAIALVNVLTK